MNTLHIATLFAVIILVLTAAIFFGEEKPTVILDIARDGSILVTHVLEVEEGVEIVKVRAISEPASDAVAYEKEPYLTEINCSRDTCDIIVYYPDAGSLNITYLVTGLTNYSGGVWTVNFITDADTLVMLPKDTVPIFIPEDFISIRERKGRYFILLPRGEHVIEYVLLIEIPKKGVEREEGGVKREKTQEGIMDLLLPLAILAVVVAVFLKIKSKREFKELSETDRLILKTVKKKKSLTLSELVRETGLPKTTVYRRVNRLAEAGYLKIERKGYRLVITLA